MLGKYLKLAVVLIFVALVAVQASKPYVLDEIDFPVVSAATSISGKPIYYRGEQASAHVGTYHPTLYINSLAVFMKFFGRSEASVRFFGAFCALASAGLMLLVLRMLVRTDSNLEAIFLALFLLNPYTIANATLPDIDSTILPVVMLAFIYAALVILYKKKGKAKNSTYILGALFGLALWSKLTTPLVLPVFMLALVYIVTKDKKVSIVQTAKVTAFGAVAFLSTYFVYCKSLGLSTTYTYRFLIDSFTKGTSTDGPLTGALNNLGNAGGFLFWPTLPLVVLFAVSFIGVMSVKNSTEEAKIKKLLSCLGLAVTVFYVALISPFGGFFKYPFAVFGLCLMTIVFFYDGYVHKLKSAYLWSPAFVLVGFLIEHNNWRDEMFIQGRPFRHVMQLALLSVVIYLALRLWKNQKAAAGLLSACLMFAIGFQTSVSRVQAVSDYPTKYHYGQHGLLETAQYIKSQTVQGEAVWAMKDVGYYGGNRYEESYGYFFDAKLQEKLVALLAEGKIRYYVVTTGIGQDNIDYYTDVKTILESGATREKQFGNFIVYKAKEN